MKTTLTLGLLAAMTLIPPASGQQVRQINTCFEESIAALRSTQLEQGIAHCDKVIDNKSTSAEQRARAYAQRGLMYARRWALVATPEFAFQAISDLTEALRPPSLTMTRKHLLLVIRAQLYAATGQTRRALDDYTAVLDEDPDNIAARSERKKLGPPEGF